MKIREKRDITIVIALTNSILSSGGDCFLYLDLLERSCFHNRKLRIFQEQCFLLLHLQPQSPVNSLLGTIAQQWYRELEFAQSTMRRQISEFGKIKYLEVVEWSIEKIDVCSNRCPGVHVHIYYKLVAAILQIYTVRPPKDFQLTSFFALML